MYTLGVVYDEPIESSTFPTGPLRLKMLRYLWVLRMICIRKGKT